MVRSKRRLQLLLPLAGFWALACQSPMSDDGEVTTNGGTCVLDSSAAEVVVLSDTGVAEDCVISLVEQDPADARRWTISADCDATGFSVELMVDPPVETIPLELGEQVGGAHLVGPDGHYVELLVDSELRLVTADVRLPGAETPFEKPLFPPGLLDLVWSVIPGCTAADPQCGVVDIRQVEAYLDTTLDPQIAALGPGQPYGELTDADHHFGVWLGPNWISDCNGETTSQVSYVIMALP